MSLPLLVAPRVLRDAADFATALDALARHDASFMTSLDALCDRPQLRRREPGFEGLASIIVAQQVSTASANAIFGRFKARLDPFDAAGFDRLTDEDLRACGLSAPKVRTLRAIAAAIGDGTLALEGLADMDAEGAHASLCAIKGIGPWTADIFLLFCLGHADAWPAGDLALQEGAKLVLGLTTRPTTKELHALGERWRPLRGVAAHCLWAYYTAARMRGATLEPTPPPAAKVSTPPRKRRKP